MGCFTTRPRPWHIRLHAGGFASTWSSSAIDGAVHNGRLQEGASSDPRPRSLLLVD